MSFVPLPDNDNDGIPDGGAPLNYVRFTQDGGRAFSDSIGMRGGEQTAQVSTDTFQNEGSNIHEIGHMLGLYHEHQHPGQ